jgi:hypothetical protein
MFIKMDVLGICKNTTVLLEHVPRQETERFEIMKSMGDADASDMGETGLLWYWLSSEASSRSIGVSSW